MQDCLETGWSKEVSSEEEKYLLQEGQVARQKVLYFVTSCKENSTWGLKLLYHQRKKKKRSKVHGWNVQVSCSSLLRSMKRLNAALL